MSQRAALDVEMAAVAGTRDYEYCRQYVGRLPPDIPSVFFPSPFADESGVPLQRDLSSGIRSVRAADGRFRAQSWCHELPCPPLAAHLKGPVALCPRDTGRIVDYVNLTAD